MADTVSGQITDSVSQTNVKVLGDAPAQALGSLYQSLGQTTSLAGGNQTTEQQQTNVLHQATTTMGVTLLYAIGTAVGSQASIDIANDKQAPVAKA
jgi:hypothetical protein